MKLLITGANGQLGMSLQKVADQFPEFSFIYTDQTELDITSYDAICALIREERIEGIINCAAYTAVDKAEDQIDLAFLINEKGSLNLAKACKETACTFLHISTEYVFSGEGFRPYLSSEPTNPSSVYAKSKAAGEAAIMKINPDGWIVRTSWLYSEFGQNFVKTMLRLGNEREQLNVISDQIGSPCYATDLALAILNIFKHKLNNSENSNGISIYHYANSGCASWFDFTKAIMEFGKLECTITPIPSEMYPLPATRPFYSVLNTDSTARDFGISIPYWRDSLKNCIEILLTK
ncbi:MAG: dTDP-4-dehydrorhamnose reductase [Bacteroidales bacterium]|nr:dTDP-4-dehydrorhamnose reductase [Bacteroidales bacterium]